MNKTDLINKIRTDAGLTVEQATAAMQAVEFGIAEALEAGESVQLKGFGTFNVVKRNERQGRNPKTGEALIIPAKTTVKFKAGKGLSHAIN